MQTLKDAAALAVLVLLALTVRVSLDGTPVDLELGTPVEAAAGHGALDESPPETAAHPTDEASLPGVAIDAAPVLPRLVVPTPSSSSTDASAEPRQLVWEIDGRRFVVVLSGEPSAEIDPPSTPTSTSEPCDQARRARLCS
jgi:hypothetical protein